MTIAGPMEENVRARGVQQVRVQVGQCCRTGTLVPALRGLTLLLLRRHGGSLLLLVLLRRRRRSSRSDFLRGEQRHGGGCNDRKGSEELHGFETVRRVLLWSKK